MGYRASNQNRAGHTNLRCVMCGNGIMTKHNRSLDLLCLICRAAILDRIFQARRQRISNGPEPRSTIGGAASVELLLGQTP